MIALLTGPPGVGKTTVATELARGHAARIESVSFGQLIYASVRARLGQDFTYAEFRESASRLVTKADIETATEAVARKAVGLAETWLLVDSHAVAKTRYGWQAHPDNPATITRFAYDLILYLDAPADIVLARARNQMDGRAIISIRDIDILARLQMSISSYYAGIINCPLEVVDATGDVASVVGTLEGLLGLVELR